jgi:hypothetical protein
MLQKLFDNSVYPLIEQGKPSLLGEDGSCAYRGVDGAKCAIGMLITDEAYTNEIETSSVDRVEVLQALYESGYHIKFNSEHNSFELNLLKKLQHAHDNHIADTHMKSNTLDVDAWLTQFKDECKAIAKEYGLECTL